ncbi:hypothetical protein R6Q57_000708 [Mikania cordata]
MAVDLVNLHRSNAFIIKTEQNSVQEAAVAGLQSLQNLIRLLSHSPPYNQTNTMSSSSTDYSAVADVAVTKFKKFISLLDRNRTGHARFRRGPSSNPPPPDNINHQNRQIGASTTSAEKVYSPAPMQQLIPPVSQTKENPVTSINFGAGDTGSLQPSMSSGFQISNLSQVSSAVQSSSSLKRKCNSVEDSHTGCASSSGRCHCSKKRKLTKRVVRVPAISMKISDIPPDDYSWRKYGQKPIKGSPHPRGYYRCSSVRGCPARKKVERATDVAAMLIVTYEGDHNHSQNVNDSPAPLVLESS